MVKKMTAGVLAMMMIFGTGVLQTPNVLPETAITASAQDTAKDEIMSELEAKLTYTNDMGARYVTFGTMTKDETHATQGFFDRKYTFEIKGEELVKAMDGELGEMLNQFTFTALAKTDKYASVKIRSALLEGVINYRSGESRMCYSRDIDGEINYLTPSFTLKYDDEDSIFVGNYNVTDIRYTYDPEEIDSIVLSYWINTDDIELNYPAETPPTADKIVRGDINGDGVLDITDVSLLMNHINGIRRLSLKERLNADVDHNNTPDIADVSAMINHINGVKNLW